jgi:hypothetical protein
MRRRMMFSWRALMPLLVVGLTSCGSSPYTLGTACNEVGAAYCARGYECGAFTSISTCRSDFHDGCCGAEGTCGDRYDDASEDDVRRGVHACAQSYDLYTCAQLYGYGGVTPECLPYYYSAAPVVSSPAPVKTEEAARVSGTKEVLTREEIVNVARTYGRGLPRLPARPSAN